MNILKNSKYYFSLSILSSALLYVMGYYWSEIKITSSENLSNFLFEAISKFDTILALLYFVLMVVLLHFVWSLVLATVFQLFSKYLCGFKFKIIRFLFFFTSLLWFFGINEKLFPLSKIALIHDSFLSSWLFLGVVAFFYIGALLVWLKINYFRVAQYNWLTLLLLGLVAIVNFKYDKKLGDVPSQPNIILIGIDSLRPDSLAINGFIPSLTPNIDVFLSQAQVVEETLTPNARTTVAWTSIITGKTPLHHGARFNLTSKERVEKENTIAKEFQKQGYRTIYAIDERRFNNIDETYGFDSVIGPPSKVSAFLLGGLSDLPLVNLISQTWLGKYMFPASFNNRASYWNYDPLDYVDQVIAELKKTDNHKPMLLMNHFVLPHYPFINNGMKSLYGHPEVDKNSVYALYLQMLQLVDSQFSFFMMKLAKEGYLDNAHVFLLSDHGESFKITKDLLIKGDERANFEVNAYGHGTNVSDLSQYKVILGYKAFGQALSKTVYPNDINSLLDITSSLCDEILDNCQLESDGYNLFDPQNSLHDHEIILESSLSFGVLNADRINEIDLIKEGVSFYSVNSEGGIIVKPAVYNAMIDTKQRSLVSHNWQVSFYPDMLDMYVFIDRKENKWWPSVVYPGDGPMKDMKDKLCEYYKNDIGIDKYKFCEK